MIGKESVLKVTDNSGIIYAKCINISSSVNLNQFELSNVVTIMPKILKYSKPLRKRKYLGLIVSLRKITRRSQGVWIRSHRNRLLLLNESFKFLGTRVYGPICREIRQSLLKTKYRKIISYSKITL